MLTFQYNLRNLCMSRSGHIKGSDVHIHRKLHFHQYGDFAFPLAVIFLGLIHSIKFSFPITHSLVMYFALARFKLQYASVARNSIMIADSNKFQRIKIIATPCSQYSVSLY